MGVVLIVAFFAGGSSATLHAQNATVISASEACTVVLSYLSDGFVRQKAWVWWGPRQDNDAYWKGVSRGQIVAAEPTPSGMRFRLKHAKEHEVSFEYKDFSAVEATFSFGNKKYPIINFKPAIQKGNGMTIDGLVPDDRLAQGLNKLVSDAHAGYPYECHSAPTPADAAKELADFQQKAAAWRALNPKPPVSDEVTKKRLLAEDAVEQKNFDAAAGYYRAGVTLDPTWAPGWFNAALINAELKNYADAAFDMKHYLILLPDAPDAAAAKEKVLLWEAKAEQGSAK
jgi:hypothetical protein